MTASSIGCTPLSLNAEPHRTGYALRSMVSLRIPARISSSVSSPDSKVLLGQLVAGLGDVVQQLSAVFLGLVLQVGGTLMVS